MKFLILVCAVFVAVLADVSHVARQQYIPPPIPQFRSRLPSGGNFIPRGAAQTNIPSFAAPSGRGIDSATQGPSPEDIATPEPEYIDIDLPPSGPAPLAPAPAPRSLPPSGHAYRPDGYHYRSPRKFRRVYRRRH